MYIYLFSIVLTFVSWILVSSSQGSAPAAEVFPTKGAAVLHRQWQQRPQVTRLSTCRCGLADVLLVSVRTAKLAMPEQVACKLGLWYTEERARLIFSMALASVTAGY